VEVFGRLKQTQDDRIEIVLPATPALQGIKEVGLLLRRGAKAQPVDLTILTFDFIPFDAAFDSPRRAGKTGPRREAGS
jgi:hypothetical protein